MLEQQVTWTGWEVLNLVCTLIILGGWIGRWLFCGLRAEREAVTVVEILEEQEGADRELKRMNRKRVKSLKANRLEII